MIYFSRIALIGVIINFVLKNGLLVAQPDVLNPMVVEQISIINHLADSMYKARGNSARLEINKLLCQNVEKFLLPASSFHVSPDSLKRIGHLLSPDKKFRILTWNVPLTDGTHRYFGYIQMAPGLDTVCSLHSLSDSSYTFSTHPVSITLNANRWFGALYYQVVPVKTQKQTVYTLLATRYNNLFTTQKVIEALYFNEKGEPVFGLPVFELGLKPEKRVIFEYSINAVMNMKYFENLKMIVFDHLAPSSNLHHGNYQFYGPDFTFDGYKFEKGMWRYYPNVNFKKMD